MAESVGGKKKQKQVGQLGLGWKTHATGYRITGLFLLNRLTDMSLHGHSVGCISYRTAGFSPKDSPAPPDDESI